jgi:hypothetical protein
VELANADVSREYQLAERALIDSREGSEYIRRRIAEVELDNKLIKLACVKPGLNMYEGEPPSQDALRTASLLGRTFIGYGLIPDAVTASSEGGIAICFMRNQKYADVECLNSGEILAVRYSAADDPAAWEIRPDAVASDATAKTFSEYLSA